MEPNFQTSFIPKKPIIEQRVNNNRPIGFFAVISIFIFFTMLVASGGVYFLKGVQAKKIVQMEADLALARNRFEPSKLSQLQALDKRLRASTEVLNQHIAITPIFEMLEKFTMKTVRFTKFSYEMVAAENSAVTFTLEGQAIGYRSVALQSDLLTTNKQVIDPVFSDLSLDEKGNVLFKLSFSVDPAFVDYKQVLKTKGLVKPVNPLPVSVNTVSSNTSTSDLPEDLSNNDPSMADELELMGMN